MHASAVPLDKQMREGISEKLIHLIRYAAAGTGSNGIIKLRYLLMTAASSFCSASVAVSATCFIPYWALQSEGHFLLSETPHIPKTTKIVRSISIIAHKFG